ncbi:GTPase ObgE [Weissella halotolerans]|uniref:GTPase Obg n=1 Tax=Weissella halotolerans DSM 20190 TaxID=1123500 RepID=A0A0R2FTE2_9LACO|nr:GTPase ObgE [Weissella halotolerans]KRN31666.1 GTPase CgtA [Weissella halotolerans DSM 20190]
MAFVDQVKINVKAGKGGDGAVSFRHEKYINMGGPFGGDGGRGGSVVMVVDEGLRTLMDFRYQRHFKAKPGENGATKGMTGRSADDLVIRVPEGTIVTDANTGKVIGDLTQPGQRLVVAKGGQGGRGNIHFATSKNPAPEIAENGEPGQEIDLSLELRVLADVGLVGFPSVGKSTLLATVTDAKPKVAAYQFTTLKPNLGMVRLKDGRDFVMADLPGLIEGASEGVGLGIQFLRHVERTRVILHMIDMSGIDPDQDPYQAYKKINAELAAYDPALLERPQIIVPTKMDMPAAEETLAKFKAALAADETTPSQLEIMPISALTREGVTALLQRTADLLDETPQFIPKGLEAESKTDALYEFKASGPAFEVHHEADGLWVLTGDEIERLMSRTNTNYTESLMRFARRLRQMGVDKALADAGAVNGDTVQILDYQFEYEA